MKKEGWTLEGLMRPLLLFTDDVFIVVEKPVAYTGPLWDDEVTVVEEWMLID